MAQFLELLGLFGAFLILGAYAALRAKKMSSDGLYYSVANFVGALFVLLSLLVKFSLGAFVLEAAWVLISLQGIMAILKSPGESTTSNSHNEA